MSLLIGSLMTLLAEESLLEDSCPCTLPTWHVDEPSTALAARMMKNSIAMQIDPSAISITQVHGTFRRKIIIHNPGSKVFESQKIYPCFGSGFPKVYSTLPLTQARGSLVQTAHLVTW